jgi:RNase adaptor protein for sRNA GlmZ degradation
MRINHSPAIINNPAKNKHETIIGVVGPCGAGKSSVVAALKPLGYLIRHIAQEHSYVPDMWRRLTNPDILIYLDVSYENSILRRKLDWTYIEYQEQCKRLSHARQHADFYIDTNDMVLEDVLISVESFIKSYKLSMNSK